VLSALEGTFNILDELVVVVVVVVVVVGT